MLAVLPFQDRSVFLHYAPWTASIIVAFAISTLNSHRCRNRARDLAKYGAQCHGRKWENNITLFLPAPSPLSPPACSYLGCLLSGVALSSAMRSLRYWLNPFRSNPLFSSAFSSAVLASRLAPHLLQVYIDE